MRLLRRLTYLVSRRRREDDLADEIAFHRAMKEQELRREGVAEAGIAPAARRAIGNELLARERARDVWVSPWLHDLSQDLRFGWRMLVRDPRLAIAAILTLGLGIGVLSAVFTIVNATLFRDLPFEDADRLITIRTQDPRGFPAGVSYPDFIDWQRGTTAFEELCAEIARPVSLSDAARPAERLSGLFVSHRTFRTLRVAPVLGRDFSPEDDRTGAAPVAILSHALWQTRYGGAASIVGQVVRINEEPATVIGVMPGGFAYPLVTDLWMPLSMVPGLPNAPRTSSDVVVLGRLKPEADLERARAEIDAVTARIARDHPELTRELMPAVTTAKASYLGTGAGTLLITLLGAAAVVLLIACANVANLLLARSWHRSREIAIRLALGATRWRVVRQLLVECLLVAAGGGALGVYLSFFGIDAMSRAFTVIEITAPDRPRKPFWFDPSMDGVAWVFLGAACLLAAVAAGLIPALQLSRPDADDTLRDSGRGQATHHSRRWAGALVVGQLAMALTLLAGGALFARAFVDLYYTDLVVDTRGVVMMRLQLPEQQYATSTQRHEFFRRLDDRLISTAAFSASTLSSDSPLYPLLAERRTLAIDGREPDLDGEPPRAVYVTAGPRYFETVRLAPVRGRVLRAEDAFVSREGAVVNERFVSMFFPGAEPIGRRIQLTPAETGASVPWLTIVGVVPTLPDFLPSVPPEPVVYVPLMMEVMPPHSVSVIVRASSKAAAAAALREQIAALDADLPVFAIQTLDEAVALSRMGARMAGSWFQALALIAVIFAIVGLHALTAHTVAQRTHEIGVRMALGADTGRVVWLFMRRTLVHLVIGFAIGSTGALSIGTLVAAFLGETNPRDPLTLTLVIVSLGAVALASSAMPARRAARVNPVVALRAD